MSYHKPSWRTPRNRPVAPQQSIHIQLQQEPKDTNFLSDHFISSLVKGLVVFAIVVFIAFFPSFVIQIASISSSLSWIGSNASSIQSDMSSMRFKVNTMESHLSDIAAAARASQKPQNPR